jgi:predicted CoA-binding protein
MNNNLANVEGDRIQAFLASHAFGVIGASGDRSKYGNKVLRCYMQNHKKVFPVNPHEEKIEGLFCVHQLIDLPIEVKSISIITPPAVTEKIVDQAIIKGINNIWMQPGAESKMAIRKCEEHQLNIIAEGPCILVVLNYREKE